MIKQMAVIEENTCDRGSRVRTCSCWEIAGHRSWNVFGDKAWNGMTDEHICKFDICPQKLPYVMLRRSLDVR